MNFGFNSDVNTVSRHESTVSKHESTLSKHESTVSRPVSKPVSRPVSTTPTPGGSKGTNTIVFIATGVII